MPSKFTVFGRLIDKGDKAQVYFDQKGQVTATSVGSVAHVEFFIDEHNDPVGHVLSGAGALRASTAVLRQCCRLARRSFECELFRRAPGVLSAPRTRCLG